MITVMILKSLIVSADEKLSVLYNIYVPLLTALLRLNGIKCEIADLNGFDKEYKILSKTKENIIYVPKFETCKKEAEAISFIYTDATSSLSTSFRIASIVRELRSNYDENRVVFVEQIKDSDAVKGYSHVMVDNVRIPEDFKLYGSGDFIYCHAVTLAEGICRYFGLPFSRF